MNTSFWGDTARMPLADLKYFDKRVKLGSKEFWKRRQEYIRKYPKFPQKAGGADPHFWKLDFLGEAYQMEQVNRTVGKPPVLYAHTILPIDSTTIKVFLIQHNKQVQVWEAHGIWQPKKCEWRIACQRLPDEAFTIPFLEPFFIFAQKEDYYFLTQSGKLFIARAPEQGKRRQMEALWQDKSKPLTTFISDNDHQKAYCFSKSKDGKEEFFFELAPKIQPQPVPRKEIQPVQVEQPRLRTVLEYVQVLPSRQEKKKEK
jgi:hypothetical protein